MVKKFYEMAVGQGGGLVIDPFKERVNYIFADGMYIGSTVNLPIVCEAETLEGLVNKMKILSELYIKHMAESLKQDEPFEIKQLTIEQWERLK